MKNFLFFLHKTLDYILLVTIIVLPEKSESKNIKLGNLRGIFNQTKFVEVVVKTGSIFFPLKKCALFEQIKKDHVFGLLEHLIEENQVGNPIGIEQNTLISGQNLD